MYYFSCVFLLEVGVALLLQESPRRLLSQPASKQTRDNEAVDPMWYI